MKTNITLFLALLAFYFGFNISVYSQIDTPIYQSSQTRSYTLQPMDFVVMTDVQRNDLIDKLAFTLKYNNDKYKELADPGGAKVFFKNYVNPAVDVLVDGIFIVNRQAGGLLKMGTKIRDKYYNDSEANSSIYKIENLWQKNDAAKNYFARVRKTCDNNIDCISQNTDKILQNPEVRKQIGGDISQFDEATIRELIIADSKNKNERIDGLHDRFDTIEQMNSAGFTVMFNQLGDLNLKADKLLKNTAQIIHLEAKNAVAISILQKTVEENDKNIMAGIGDIKVLQQQNIFLSETILKNTEITNEKLDVLTVKENEAISLGKMNLDLSENIRATQLSDRFKSLPTSEKLAELNDPNSETAKLFGDKVESMKESLKVLEVRERVVAITKNIQEWGAVGKAALNTFCPDCPSEVGTAVDLALTATNIVGSIASGNYAQAVLGGLSAIGLFGSPKPGPEMQMLTKISDQVKGLEKNMNNQFKDVHQHLFSMEDNLVKRLDIVNLKLDNISEQIGNSYVQLSGQLSTIDAKANYIIRQNECTQGSIINIFKENGFDKCRVPVKEFKERIKNGKIRNISDLNNFFIGQQCESCVRAIFDLSNEQFEKSKMFQYSDCRTTGSESVNNQPDKLYEFVYNSLFDENQKRNPIDILSVLLVPNEVKTSAFLRDSISFLPDSIKNKLKSVSNNLQFIDNDRFYRNYQSVLDITDYTLTMFPFLEMYNDGRLFSSEEINSNAGISKERAKKLVSMLDNLSSLCNRTIFQQSLITGNGVFKAVDKYIQKGLSEHDLTSNGSDVVFKNLFDFNPYFNKNYSTYFIDKFLGGFSQVKKAMKNSTIVNPVVRLGQGYKYTVSKDSKDNYIVSVQNRAGTGNIFTTQLPTVSGSINEKLYNQYLSFAFPQSIIDLSKSKKLVDELRAEMIFILSDEMDKPNAKFTRKDLNIVINESRK